MNSAKPDLARSQKQQGMLWVAAAAVLWGTTGTAQAFAPPGAQPAAIGAIRLAIGGLALLAVALARGAFHSGKRWPRATTALAAGCMAGYQLCFFAAVAKTGVAVGTIVAIGSAPVLAGFLGFLAYGEQPGRKWALATALAILGCATLILASGDIRLDTAGVLLALGAGACYATYAVASKQALKEHPAEAVMAVVFCLGAILIAPILLVTDLGWLARWRGIGVALHLGLVATAAAYLLFGRGLKLIPVPSAVTLSLVEPLTAGFLGVFVLGERLVAVEWLGVGLLLTGLMLLTR